MFQPIAPGSRCTADAGYRYRALPVRSSTRMHEEALGAFEPDHLADLLIPNTGLLTL